MHITGDKKVKLLDYPYFSQTFTKVDILQKVNAKAQQLCKKLNTKMWLTYLQNTSWNIRTSIQFPLATLSTCHE